MASARQNQRLHHQGWLNIKFATSKEYKKSYVKLKGSELIISENEAKVVTASTMASQQATHRVALTDMVNVKFDVSQRVISNKSSFPTISLEHSVFTKGIRIRAESNEEQQKWFRYLHVIILQTLPNNTENMLPGQITELNDILENAKQDLYLTPTTPTSPSIISSDSTCVSPPFSPKRGGFSSTPLPIVLKKTAAEWKVTPKWFFKEPMSRETAEKLLRQNEHGGNMIMRMRDATDEEYKYAVSVKTPNVDEFKHYRVKKTSVGAQCDFQIYLGGKVHPKLSSFTEVVDYFVKTSDGKYAPLQQNVFVRNNPTPVYAEDLEKSTTYYNMTAAPKAGTRLQPRNSCPVFSTVRVLDEEQGYIPSGYS